MKPTFNKLCLVTAIGIILNLGAWAQKLPSEQKEGVFAPANVQIDGKATEWAGKFRARNTATLLIYVMANDADYLYLAIQSDPAQGVSKIFYGGISLAIKSRRIKR